MRTTPLLLALCFHQLAAAGVALTMLLTLRPTGPRLHLGLILLLLLPCALLVGGTAAAAVVQLAAYAAIATAPAHYSKGASV